MLQKEKTIFTNIGKDEIFNNALLKLFSNRELSQDEKTYLLTCAILFLNYYKKDKRYTSYADFAYFIILKYALSYNDYTPLYDFSTNFGFYPITKAILNNNLIDNFNISTFFIDLNLEKFENEKEYVETLEQHIESKKFLNDTNNEKSYLAPTSFGKSSVIIDYIKRMPKDNAKIVIVVPTKSLLMQTYQMIREAKLNKKIIIHDEMYNGESSFIAIFTQERSLRLLNSKNINFDVLFIDEAHNILNSDDRSILLSRLIAKNRTLNLNQKVIYLSPLIENVENLKVYADQSIATHHIIFNIKEPEIYEYRLNKEVHKYNRFTDQFYEIGKKNNKFSYLKENSKEKNFIYNLSPLKIELFAKQLNSELYDIDISNNPILQELQQILRKEVHKDFYAIEYLKSGVIYLHGKLPDLIKEYLESKFKSIPEFKYIIANSVILEGMNLPIDCLFILNTRGLYGKELINLIGRVNRLNNIFSSDTPNLSKLLPQIHFINSEKFNRKDSNMSNKISLLRNRVFIDKTENPTLNSYDFEKQGFSKENKEAKRKQVVLIQENERFLYSQNNNEDDLLKKYLIETGIANFYININEVIDSLLLKINQINTKQILEWEDMSMMNKIEFLFIKDIQNIKDFEFERLKNENARNYYENYILINQKRALNENIVELYKYLNERAKGSNPKYYIGKSYGEEPKDSAAYPQAINNVYVDLSTKSSKELINLAIVKLKMEDDFISYKLSKFIIMMYDYKLITQDNYNLYIYGTTDLHKINLTKYGLSISLITRLEKDSQLKNLKFDEFNNLIGNDKFDKFKNSIDDFYRFEITRYLN